MNLHTACLIGILLVTGACGLRDRPPLRQVPGGDPNRGRTALEVYGCGACHSVPGVRRARGVSAPPLNDYGDRSFVAGVIANSSENLIRWIVAPQTVNPLTAMPDLGVNEQDARDIAAYLYTLRR